MSLDIIDKKKEKFIQYFFYSIFPDFYREYSKVNYINFQFNRDDIKKIVALLKKKPHKKGYILNSKKIIEIIEKLNNNKNNDMIIRVDNIDEFFDLLQQIKEESDKRIGFELFTSRDLLTTMWLRMGPDDFNNVNLFLKRQLSFIKNDLYFGTKTKRLKRNNNLALYYRNQSNQNWFETNSYIEFYLEKNTSLPYTECYYFPSIHYGLTEENGEKVVCLYGIQNVNENEKNPEVRKEFQSERKKLRNSEVSPDFILALKYFIDLMQSKGITTIKVPMLQVYNYEYHTALSEQAERDENYTEEEEKVLNEMINAGIENDETLDYMFTNTFYKRFYNKQDIISKNKTERLLSTILLMQEIYGNIEILNEPMVQGDYLIISIINQNDKAKEMIKE